MPVAQRTTQAVVLKTMAARIADKVDPLSATTCFIADHPVPASYPPGDTLCTVVPGDSTFDTAVCVGGAHATIAESCPLLVTPLVRVALDKPPELESALVGTDAGLLSLLKGRILKALIVEEKQAGYDSWHPPGRTGSVLLRELLMPQSCTMPFTTKEGWIGVTIRFSMVYDWEL